jgi:hypothetical protein
VGECGSRVWRYHGQAGGLGRHGEYGVQSLLRLIVIPPLGRRFTTETCDGSIQVVASGDLAIYATLTSLATCNRSAIKALLLDNVQMRYFMDYGSAAYTRDLVDCYMHAHYRRLLEILHERKVNEMRSTRRHFCLTLNLLAEPDATPDRSLFEACHCRSRGSHSAKRPCSVLSTLQ